MSKISTKRGDGGFSDLLGGGRVKKSHPIYDALGDLDELSAALGVIRVLAQAGNHSEVNSKLDWVQRELIQGMGDVASLFKPDLSALTWRITSETLNALDNWGIEIEEAALQSATLRGWALPGGGGSMISAQFDVARTVCRRAERSVFAILDELPESDIMHAWNFPKFLNRLSDVLWMEGRVFEASHQAQ